MAQFDPLFNGVAALLESLDGFVEFILDPEIDDQQVTEILGQAFEDLTPADELGAAVVDIVEEFVLAEIDEEGELTPENVEGVADATEGAAVSVLTGVGVLATSLEAASLGQVDKQAEYLTQALAGLGVDDVTGMELDARIEEGIKPAMQARIGKEHRAKFVDLADAVEYLLRSKTGDSGFLQGSNIPQSAYSVVASDVPVNANNALEEWGIRDDQLQILEEVSISVLEPEELIETPAELGLIVSEETLEQELDRAGLSEDVKDLFNQIPEAVRRSNRVWEEKTALEPMVDRLESLADSGELRPEEAANKLPPEADDARAALEDRYRNLSTLSQGKPSQSEFESAFSRGFRDLDDLVEFLDDAEFNTSAYDDVVRTLVLDELDGDLQESVALGLIDETTYSDLAAFAGLDQAATDALLSGQSLGDITKRRLQEEQDPADLPVGAIQGIGESRSQSLQVVDIETVEQLANAETDVVADATNVSPETADTWITQANQLTE